VEPTRDVGRRHGDDERRLAGGARTRGVGAEEAAILPVAVHPLLDGGGVVGGGNGRDGGEGLGHDGTIGRNREATGARREGDVKRGGTGDCLSTYLCSPRLSMTVARHRF